jgi:hypothetical protein
MHLRTFVSEEKLRTLGFKEWENVVSEYYPRNVSSRGPQDTAV